MKRKNCLKFIMMFFVLMIVVACASPESKVEKISFNDKTVEYTGKTQKISIKGSLPKNYTVEYENNEGVESGRYYAKAYVKNPSNDVVKTLGATLFIDNPENKDFEAYLDDFFVKYLEDDQLSVNIFTEKPNNFGLEAHYDATWYTYEPFENYEEAQASDKEEFEGLLEELEIFKDAKISEMQMVSYKAIESFLTYNLNTLDIPYVFFMENHYVDQFGGYVADFSTYMEAYSLREEGDITDLISFIESTKDAFPSYALFVDDKAKHGFPLTDNTLKLMQEYLDNVLEDEKDYYLKDVLAEHVNAVSFIGKAKKDEYIAKINKAIDENFMNGVKALDSALDNQYGKADKTNSSYLASYENGKDLYLLKLSNTLGINNLDPNQYVKDIDNMLDFAVKKIISLQETMVKKYNIKTYDDLEELLASQVICEGTPDEMMSYLKEFAKTIVPKLKSEPKITIKNMDDASAEASNAVAYYMKSALDNTSAEKITLNQLKLGDKNDVLSTLGHEGYPGHLYAYCFSKELDLHNIAKIMTNTAHGEGWATFTELKLYDYAKEKNKDSKFKSVMNYLYYNALSGHLLETRIDFGIHYQGWTTSRIATYLSNMGYDSSIAQEIYDLIIEMPSTYAAYGYGKIVMYNMCKEAKEVLGEHYNEIEFNTMLLSKGWSSLDTLQETYNTYMVGEMNRYNIVVQ